MRRQRYATIIMISLLLIALTVLCANASWFIQESGKEAAVHNKGTSQTAVTESDYFDLTFTYDGKKHLPVLNETGKTAFGANTELTFEFLNGTAANGSEINSTVPQYHGVLAGTHRYKVTETTTGQVIYDNLQITVNKNTLVPGTATATAAASFVGKDVAYTVTWTPSTPDILLTSLKTTGSFTQTQNPFIFTSETTDEQKKANSRSLTTDVGYGTLPKDGYTFVSVAEDATKEEKDAHAQATTNFKNLFANNYEIPTATATLSYKVMATCYSVTGSAAPIYYGNLNQGLYETKDATTATMLVAMQSVTNGNSTYYASVYGVTNHYDHIIGGDPDVDPYADDDAEEEGIQKFINANVTLRLPYDTANELTPFRTNPNDPATDAAFLITRTHFHGHDKALGREKTANEILATTARNTTVYYAPIYDSNNKLTGYNTLYFLKNEVTVAETTTLYNQGSIEIAGQVSGGNGGYYVNSMVAGLHAQIKMMDNAKIISDGTITCYGFITEAEENNGSEVIANSGSKTTVIFSVSEHRGGQNYGAIYLSGMQSSPFNRFWIETVSSKLTVHYGAKLLGRVDLYADDKENISDIKLIGTDDSCLISLAEGASVIAKYHHDYDAVTHTNRTTNLQIKGSASVNKLEITIVVGTMYEFILGSDRITLSTASVMFPISGYYHITLSPIDSDTPATVTLHNDMKLLPGATLTIDQGVTLSGTDKQFAIYDSMHCANSIGAAAAYQFTEPAKLTVNGAIEIGVLGGKIYTEQANAHIEVASTTIAPKEISVCPGKISDKVEWAPQTYTLSLQRYQADGTVSTGFTSNLPAATYPSVQVTQGTGTGATTTAGWYFPYPSITLNANGGVFLDGSEQVTERLLTSLSSGTTQERLDALSEPSYVGHGFKGWGTTATATTPVDPSTIKFDTTLYAIWEEAVTYQVTFDPNGKNEDFSSIVAVPTAETDNFTAYPKKWANSDNSTTIEYYLKGWSKTKGATTPDAKIAITEDTTLYAVWATKPTFKVTVGSVSLSSLGDLLSGDASYTLAVEDEYGNTVLADTSYTSSETSETTLHVTPGYTVKVGTVVSPGANKGGKTPQLTGGSTHTMVAGENKEFHVTKITLSCIVEGTMITLADGTRKPIEQLTKDDVVLIFNHHTGKMEPGYVAMLDHLDMEASWTDVINLQFSNGELLRTAGYHGVFDVTLNKYVFIDNMNFREFIGHEFYAAEYVDGEFVGKRVVLTDAYVTAEYVRIYNPTTVWHMNYFASGILNVTSNPDINNVSGHVNYFDLDENMKYDEEKMAEDIEKYGLYTYEDFQDYLTEEQFAALPFAYLKVSVGKGTLTWESIITIIEYLSQSSILP